MLGLIPESRTRMYAAPAAGCGPIVTRDQEDTDVLEPLRPQTSASPLATEPGRLMTPNSRH